MVYDTQITLEMAKQKHFFALKDAKPYDDKNINKIEYVGHVQKRMGSRLRKLKLKCRKQNFLIGKLLVELTIN